MGYSNFSYSKKVKDEDSFQENDGKSRREDCSKKKKTKRREESTKECRYQNVGEDR